MINLVYCGNKFMLDGILLSLLSVSKVSKEPINVIVLTGDFQKMDPTYLPLEEYEASFLRSVIQKKNPESQLELQNVTDLICKELAETANLNSEYTPYCLFRSFLDLLVNVPSRVLYLDCDAIALRDIAPFFHSDLHGHDIGCVADAMHFGKYFNAGVMLLDMDKIRHDGLMAKARELIAIKKMKHPDQDAMNKIFHKAKQIEFFPRVYNEQRRITSSTVIRHFAPQKVWFPFPHVINVKPWEIAKIHNVYHNYEFDHLLKEMIQLKKEFSVANAAKFK